MSLVATMSDFTSILIEDSILLTVALIEIAVIVILSLTVLKNTTPAFEFYVFALLLAVVLLSLFLIPQDHFLDVITPTIETIQLAQRQYS